MSPVLLDALLVPEGRRTTTTWRDHAACRDQDLQLFFPPEHLPPAVKRQLEDRALGMCRDCPVSRACLAFSITSGQRHGVWGGLRADEPAASAARNDAPWTCDNCTRPNPRTRRRCADCGTTRD